MPDAEQTTVPQRIQRKRAKGWRMPDNTVCVDRTTGFGSQALRFLRGILVVGG